MLAALCATLVIAAARPPAAPGPAHRVAPRAPQSARRATAGPRQGSALEKARALLADVKRDPAKRRYRHRWERAIAALEKAAQGRDKAPALLEAARARYALYRFSQVDSDRDAALALARKAHRAGARDAPAFARAIRKEMGEEEVAEAPTRPRATRRAAPSTAAASPQSVSAPRAPRPSSRPGPPPPAAAAALAPPAAASDEDPPTDPILQQALEHAGATPQNSGESKEPARVSDVKAWSNDDYTRIAVYLSRSVGFTREEIPADDGHPRRLALDLKPALLGRGLAHDVGDALVQRVRAAQRDPETVRVVLDLAGRDDLAIFALEDPPRLIIDVGVSEALRDSAAQALHPAQRDAGGELASRRPIRRVIVDAGHGGHDTGAIGPTRVREKDVTLAIAKRLARRLAARGFEVVLTRRDDRFVALEERTAIANARHGDLFVSLHANAYPRRDRRGVETYVLNVADDRYAARLAARENGALGDGSAEGPQVRRILSDLDAKASVDASHRLATSVQRELCAGIRSRVGDVRDLGVKSALFYVLLGARMPAVLVETSFISNRTEEKRLSSARFQDEVANAVTRAVERFASREARVASAR
jgi:N-acetylmuramoyl-L-alanine amidase